MKKNHKIAKNIGLPPGTLVYQGNSRADSVEIEVFYFDEKHLEEFQCNSLESILPYLEKNGTIWININGLQNIELLENAGKIFQVHPLFLEDILNTEQRPKLEEGESSIFSILKMISYSDEKKILVLEQISLVLGKNFVVSFQEKKGDIFELIRERIRYSRGKIRKMKADYLYYALLDAVTDQYFLVLEKMSERIDGVEEEIFQEPCTQTLQKIHHLKKETLILKKSLWPLREMFSSLERLDGEMIRKNTKIYLKDLYDHTVQAIDYVETFRDSVSSIQDLYLSTVSNKMNEIMKVLTIIATVFIPLTFIAGIYGMNFKHMPELDKTWAYPAFWGLITAIGGAMFWFFKKKKWF